MLRGGRQVDLIRDEDLRAPRDLFAVARQLRIDLMIVLDRIAPLDARGIDDVQDETRPLHMAQEVMSEPHAVRRALDEPRNVSHDEALLIVRLHDAEHGRECRKVVVGDLRARRRTGRDETGFPDARIADKPHVRE